jgi:prophage regulatory protein
MQLDTLVNMDGIVMKHRKNETQLGTTNIRLIRIKEVIELSGLSRSYIYTLSAEGLFPKSVPLVPGGSARAWVHAEVVDWLDERVSARDMEV